MSLLPHPLVSMGVKPQRILTSIRQRESTDISECKKAKKFNPKDINSWVSGVEAALMRGSMWRGTAPAT